MLRICTVGNKCDEARQIIWSKSTVIVVQWSICVMSFQVFWDYWQHLCEKYWHKTQIGLVLIYPHISSTASSL